MNTNIQISEIKIFPIKNGQTKVRAFAQLVLNNCFKISGLRIIEGDNGLFIGYPSEKGKDGKYYEVVHPINRKGVDVIQDSLLRQYEQIAVGA